VGFRSVFAKLASESMPPAPPLRDGDLGLSPGGVGLAAVAGVFAGDGAVALVAGWIEEILVRVSKTPITVGRYATGMRRRALLAAGSAAAVAGCLGLGGGSDGIDDGSGDVKGDGQSLASHPGAAGLADQPTLGPAPGDADATIVAFEDPSCPNCGRFHEGALPDIKSEWTSAGTASFVFRGYPIIYQWGKPAAQALESTFARSADAHWALADHYYAEQSGFDTENVFDRTESFLADRTDVDAAAVVADAREKAHDDAVQADLDAGESADVSSTPRFLLFRDGEFVTQLSGPKSFETFQSALQL
jgi:protein-disulfide isomerase